MVKYEFMGAHGRGSENKGAAKHKVGGGCEKKRVAKKMWCTHPPACVRLWEHTQTDADKCMGIIYYINGIKLSASVYNFRIQTLPVPKVPRLNQLSNFFLKVKTIPEKYLLMLWNHWDGILRQKVLPSWTYFHAKKVGNTYTEISDSEVMYFNLKN